MRFVDEVGSMSECATVVSDYNTSTFPQHEQPFPVELKPDVDSALIEEQNLVEVVKLVENNSILLLLTWLKFHENFDHIISVNLIIPSIEIVFDFGEPLLTFKKLVEIPQEMGVQKFIENAVLDLLRDLVKDVFVIIGVEGLVFITLPFVFEMFLDLVLKSDVDRCVVVKLFQNPKEL